MLAVVTGVPLGVAGSVQVRAPRMSFTGQSAVIVTGATSGIGRAAGRGVRRAKARRSCWSAATRPRWPRSPARFAAAGGAGGRLRAPTSPPPTRPSGSSNAALDAFGGIDVLVNAAGVIATGTLEATTDEVWDAMMAVNLRAPFRLMRAAAPHLTARKGVDRQRVERERPAVVSRRARVLRQQGGVDHLTRCAALEMAPLGVRVNAVNPGVTVTNLHRRSGMDEAQYAAFLERSKDDAPARPAGSARRDRGADSVSGVGPRRLDDGRDDSDRRWPAPHLRAVTTARLTAWMRLETS